MEEKIIIESKRYDLTKILRICIIVVLVAYFVISGLGVISCVSGYNFAKNECMEKWGDLWETFWFEDWRFTSYSRHSTAIEYALYVVFVDDYAFALICVGICLILGASIALLNKMQIVVSDKRVYGATYFGRRVDLPLDSISAVGSSWLKGIYIATSSSKIVFLLIKNAREIHTEISKLLIARQEKKVSENSVGYMAQSTSNADELIKYKQLLESGVITQEEFDAKKKELLGL